MIGVRRPRRLPGRAPTWAAGLVAVALMASCGGGDDDPDDPLSTTAPPPSATAATAPEPEDEAVAAYLAYWEMVVRLVEQPDPDDDELAERAQGAALASLRGELSALSAEGHAVRPGPEHDHQVRTISVVGESATVVGCVVDDREVVEVATGEAVEESLVALLYETTLTRAPNGWMVSQVTEQGRWQGATSCAG